MREPNLEISDVSLNYKTSAKTLARIIFKAWLLLPLTQLNYAIVLLMIGLLVLMDPSGVMLRSMLVDIGLIFPVILSILFAIVFVGVIFVLRQGDGYVLRLDENGVLKTHPVLAKKPVNFAWKKARRIVDWSGDVFIITFTTGALIPREAFRTEEERENVLNSARQFRLNARRTSR